MRRQKPTTETVRRSTRRLFIQRQEQMDNTEEKAGYCRPSVSCVACEAGEKAQELTNERRVTSRSSTILTLLLPDTHLPLELSKTEDAAEVFMFSDAASSSYSTWERPSLRDFAVVGKESLPQHWECSVTEHTCPIAG